MHERARAVTAMPGRGHRFHWAGGQPRGVRMSLGRLGLPLCRAESTLRGAGFGALRRTAVWRARAGVAAVGQRGGLVPVARGRAVSPPHAAAAAQRLTEWVIE